MKIFLSLVIHAHALKFITLREGSKQNPSCDDADFIVAFPGFTGKLPCDNIGVFSMNPATPHSHKLHPASSYFTSTFGSDLYIIAVDKNSLTNGSNIPKILPDPNRWKILFWNGPFSDSDARVITETWQVDAVVASNSAREDLKHLSLPCNKPSCVYEIRDKSLTVSVDDKTAVSSISFTRSVYMVPQACRNARKAIIEPSRTLLSASVSIERVLGIQFCLVGIDASIAKFEYPLEWMQATLREDPCRTSDWVILSLMNADPDPDVVDFIDNYSVVDLVISDRVIDYMNTVVWVSSQGKFFGEFQPDIGRLTSKCDSQEEAISVIRSRKSDRITATSSKFLSYTSAVNIFISFCIAGFSGLSASFSFFKAVRIRNFKNNPGNIIS
jgi:hypothetical protein